MSPPSPQERPRRFQTRSHPTASLRDPRGALLVGVVGLARFLIGRSWNQCQSPRTSASSGGVSPQDTPLPLTFSLSRQCAEREGWCAYAPAVARFIKGRGFIGCEKTRFSE